ncbi:MAG: FixH family protein [bacterium]|nr:FixH family protein [bacterium]
MKTLTLALCFTFLGLAPTAFAQGMAGMEGMDHSGNSQMSQKLGKAPLGPFKKTEYWSKRRQFKVLAPLVPTGKGMASFEITVVARDNTPASAATITSASYHMPGMEMQLPEVQVEALGDGKFRFNFPVQMDGYWKLDLHIDLGGVKDVATLKFITK